ncbi:rho GTPase-activating protein 24 isoform X1 [Hydra vulgaris]|uniref:Rho GTPase-activating protein 24 n=1 Tax=Hydra vulgaris TaxID=6087 RepID=T2M953_HYDVU|nr:rho GTPase-activating protein 24 isoform X1 [Hydra vulgaris]
MKAMQIPIIKSSPSFKKGSIPRQKTQYSGWLWKKGVLNKGSLTSRRWFEIKGDQLYYFKNKGDSNVLGEIFLPGNEIVKLNTTADLNGKYVFEITAGKERLGRPVTMCSESLLLGASSPMELEGWIKALNRVIYSPFGGGMFGRSIAETVKIDSLKGGGMVPIIVEKCVEFIRKYGLDVEGIFRVPGQQEDVESLKSAFNKGENPDLHIEKHKIDVVASVLKQYIGDLPEPVIPSENWDQFIAVGALHSINPSAALAKIEYLLQRIPRVHYNMLKYLCRFLFELQLHCESTKMSVSNLALVFAPNILRPQNNEDPENLLKSLASANATTMALIVNQNILFPVTPDEKYYQPIAVSDEKETLNAIYEDKVNSFHASKGFQPLKRSLSESSIFAGLDETRYAHNFENHVYEERYANERLNEMNERFDVEEIKSQFQTQLNELENKLESELKIREMLKMRLYDEHKARVAAEERLEQYRIGIEEYCKKFGGIDVSLS